MSDSVETVVIGSGFSGLLIARELVAAGHEVTVIERGAVRLDADAEPPERLARSGTAATDHNTEPGRGRSTPGSTATPSAGRPCSGTASLPRLLPSDFEMRSRYGIWRDWPIGYDDLVPFYRRPSGRWTSPAGPTSSSPAPTPTRLPRRPRRAPTGCWDRCWSRSGRWPIARPARRRAIPPADRDGGSRPRARRQHVGDRAGARPGRRGSPSASRRWRRDCARVADRVTEIECVAADGSRSSIRPERVVVSAHGIENAALLLRSGLGEPPVGRWLGDHTHVVLTSSCPSRWRGGARAAAIRASPMPGRTATGARSAARPSSFPSTRACFSATLWWRSWRTVPAVPECGRRWQSASPAPPSSTSASRTPRGRTAIWSSPATTDRLGLPRTRVVYPPDSDYAIRGLTEVRQGPRGTAGSARSEDRQAAPGGPRRAHARHLLHGPGRRRRREPPAPRPPEPLRGRRLLLPDPQRPPPDDDDRRPRRSSRQAPGFRRCLTTRSARRRLTPRSPDCGAWCATRPCGRASSSRWASMPRSSSRTSSRGSSSPAPSDRPAAARSPRSCSSPSSASGSSREGRPKRWPTASRASPRTGRSCWEPGWRSESRSRRWRSSSGSWRFRFCFRPRARRRSTSAGSTWRSCW